MYATKKEMKCHTKHGKMFENRQLEMNKIVWVDLQTPISIYQTNREGVASYPVLRGLSYEGTLVASCAGVALYRVTPRPDKVVQL